MRAIARVLSYTHVRREPHLPNLSITGSDHLQVVPKLVANGGEKFVVPE